MRSSSPRREGVLTSTPVWRGILCGWMSGTPVSGSPRNICPAFLSVFTGWTRPGPVIWEARDWGFPSSSISSAPIKAGWRCKAGPDPVPPSVFFFLLITLQSDIIGFVIFKVESLIFDMDGVITDTMRYHYRAWKEVFVRYGVRVSREDIYKREGQKGIDSVREIFFEHGRRHSDDLGHQVLKEKEKLFKEIFRSRFIPGSRSLLKGL